MDSELKNNLEKQIETQAGIIVLYEMIEKEQKKIIKAQTTTMILLCIILLIVIGINVFWILR